MKTTCKILKVSLILFFIGFLIHYLFAVEFRFIKEERLIKKNYYKNKVHLDTLRNDFKNYPAIDINFGINDYLDLTLRSHIMENINKSYFFDSLYNLYLDIPNIWITDTSAFLHIDYHPFVINDIFLLDTSLVIQAIDSTIKLSGLWSLKYTGCQKTRLISRLFELAKINNQNLNLIKSSLRKINCFGYEKDNHGNIIINFRTTGHHMVDVFSYILVEDSVDSLNIFKNTYTKYGLIEDNIYWFHYERIPVNYTPYLKLRNRKI